MGGPHKWTNLSTHIFRVLSKKKVLLPRDWRKYEYTAQCIPSDVCAVDVVGATKGLKGDWEVLGGWALS